MRYPLLALIFAALVLCVSCQEKPSQSGPEVRDHGYTLRKLEFTQLYMNRTNLFNMINHSPCDSNGVKLYERNGQYYYHPVQIGHICQYALSDYYNTRDEKYLNHAKVSTQALLDRATRSNGGIYFPYQFDFSQYGKISYLAPWYSGMAQGVLLSVISRLYFLTGEERYQAIADSVLATFEDYENPISTVYISTEADTLKVGENYYWVEEYPHQTRRYVLNGSISGSFGLYDHWWVFGDKKSRRLFSREMTAVKDNVLLFRNPGGISFYCLKFRDPAATYHSLHQVLLNQCFLYTGDDYFQAVAFLLFTDYH